MGSDHDEIDHESAEPVYRQLAGLLRDRILDGTYPPGRVIPSIKQLQQEHGLAIMTIRKAVDVLEAEGLVAVVPGKGTFVRAG